MPHSRRRRGRSISLLTVAGVLATLLLAPGRADAGRIRKTERERAGRLFVVAIGINDYGKSGKLPDLRFAVADASALSEKLAASATGLFKEVSTRLLTDDGATEEQIARTFEDLVMNVRPEDTVFVSFSGVGQFTADDSSKGQMFIYAHAPDGSAQVAPRPSAIPIRLLGAWLGRIQALRQVVVLDTCCATEGLEDFVRTMTERDMLLGDASARCRLVVGIDGVSLESPRDAHGVLTNVLLRGLAGDADVGPRPDGVVSSYELEVSLPRLFLEASRAGTGESGRLRALSVGRDFPVAKPGTVATQTEAKDAESSRGRERPSTPLPAAPVATPPGRNLALLFATDEYTHESWSHLANPIHDARTLAQELGTNFGFETSLVVNPTFGDMRDRLRAYQKAQYGPDDQLLVFVAGHGTYDELTKEGYIIAHDSEPSSRNDPVPRNALSNSQLRSAVDSIDCPHILVVLDTCFGGTFDGSISGATHRGGDLYADVATSEVVKRVLSYHARLYLTSGGRVYVPDGRPGQHSPFARGLIEGLRSGSSRKGLVTWNDLKIQLRSLKTEPRAGEFGNSEPGADFLFLLKPR